MRRPQRITTAFNLDFLDPKPLLLHSIAPQLSSRGWVDPVPDPLLRKSGSTGNRTRNLWICSQELWPLEDRGGHGKRYPWIKYTIREMQVWLCAICLRIPTSEGFSEYCDGTTHIESSACQSQYRNHPPLSNGPVNTFPKRHVSWINNPSLGKTCNTIIAAM
jgi:hypothetical protein